MAPTSRAFSRARGGHFFFFDELFSELDRTLVDDRAPLRLDCQVPQAVASRVIPIERVETVRSLLAIEIPTKNSIWALPGSLRWDELL